MLHAISPLPSPIHHHACPLLSISISTSASASASFCAAPFSLEDFLVAVCGLAPAQARETAKKAFDEASVLLVAKNWKSRREIIQTAAQIR